MLEELLAFYSVQFGVVGTILLAFFIILAIILDSGKVKYNKALLFILIVLTAVLPTVYFISSTIYINSISSSKGPVHWHADLEIWSCGQEVNLLDPKGLSNKIGTATLHEHNDKRIHLEGVVVTPRDASLGKFFRVIKGALNNKVLAVPTNTGIQTFLDGDSCPDGAPATINVFAYTIQGGLFTQQKLDNPSEYVISPFSQVPNGDCIIVEYGPEKETTDKLCRSYQVAEKLGKIKRGEIYGD